MFNKRAHCSLDHPNDIHTVTYPPIRCSKCTLLRPCRKCPYDKKRVKITDFIVKGKFRVTEIEKKLDAPEGYVPRLVLAKLKDESVAIKKWLDLKSKEVILEDSTNLTTYNQHMNSVKEEFNKYLQKVREFPIEQDTAAIQETASRKS